MVVRSSGPALCPSFAEVCSFLERYGAALDLPEMTFPQMERYLRDTTAVPKPLVELHIKLLRKLGKSVSTDRWEKYLAKVCQELNSTWAWELEQKGYQEMSMECKSSILKYLCECQFDDNLKFKTAINEEDPEKMRLQPIGRDRQGLMYWLQLDQEQNIRLYTEEQDDLDGSTWKCIVRTRNDLAEALELLKAQVDPNLSQTQSQNQNQTGPRSSSPTEKDPGAEAIGSTEPTPSTEEHADVKMIDPGNEEKLEKEAVKQEQPVKEENTELEVKEEKTDVKPPAFDNRVSTITTIVKSEPKNSVSVVMAPGATVTTKPELNKEEEAERAVVRSSQQAKIPLKKRELKLAESYHSNHLNNSNSSSSSIIVFNPSVIQTKDSSGREPPGGQAASQQQLVVTASRQELTNGRASLLQPHKEGQNGVIGVIGQVGVIGHVGVIRSPSERHRPLGANQQELNGPSLNRQGCRAEKEESKEEVKEVKEEAKEVSRQSVLVRKGPVEAESPTTTEAQTARKTPPPPMFVTSDRPPEGGERKVESVSVSSQDVQEDKAEDQSKKSAADTKTCLSGQQQQKKSDPQEEQEEKMAPEGSDEQEESGSTLGKLPSRSTCTVHLQKVDQPAVAKDHQEEEGLNGGGAAAPFRLSLIHI